MSNKIHFIAIGGSAMHSLAIALSREGKDVSGSDDNIFEPSKSKLEKAGLLPESIGWYPDKITEDIEAVILGMHAKKDNPELLRAQELGLSVFSYPEYLYQITKNKTRIVIAGSHGKTTITGMVLHVLNYHDIPIDFMIGAALEGYENSVHLTAENDFVILEGDEYLSSPIDSRSKFLWYQPHLAVISGIARDHVNVFPTDESYVQQFESFIESIEPGGVLIYNTEDVVLTRIVLASQNTIKKTPYRTADNQIVDGVTYLETDEGGVPLSVFGDHNMSNLSAARWITQLVGVSEEDFVEAITSFKGASKRLELVVRGFSGVLFKDFAHAPSKVVATTNAVQKQFGKKRILACLELHTYSSLNPEFMINYQGSLAAADEAIVFYDPEALKIKNRPNIAKEDIEKAFQHPALKVFTVPADLHHHLLTSAYNDTVLLMMSSGNYGAIDWDSLADRVHCF